MKYFLSMQNSNEPAGVQHSPSMCTGEGMIHLSGPIFPCLLDVLVAT